MGEVNVVMGKGAPLGAMSFVAGRGEFEEKTVTLKIENFAEFLTTSNPGLLENCLTFEAGTCILQDGTKTAAIWKYFIQHTKKGEEDWIGAYLSLQNDDKKVKCAKASYSVSFSSGGNPIIRFRAELKEFATVSGWGGDKVMGKAAILEKTKVTNTLDVSLIVKVFSSQGFKPVLQPVPSSPSAGELKGQADADFVKMLETADGADVEVKVPKEAGEDVDEASYSKMVHKGILMSRSPVFSKMFAKESTMIEAKTGKVVIQDLSPKGLGVFLHYLYTGEVLANWTEVFEEIINAAEKYDCGKLKQYCGHTLLAAVTTANALKMYKFAKLHSLSFAAKGVMEFIHKNMTAVVDQDADADNDENE